MDTLTTDRRIIRDVLADYARIPYAYGDLRGHVVFDTEVVGWDRGRRVHGCLVHVDLIDGKFRIQRDQTERGIAPDLEAAGVPRDRIVLAFRSPEIRRHTGYAVT